MRDLTEKEKKIIERLKEFSSNNGQSISLGNLLRKVFPIEYIEKNCNEDEFYKQTVVICYDKLNTNYSDILEAINLFVLLSEKGYILIKQFFEGTLIGEKNELMRVVSEQKHWVEERILNYHKLDLWELLNSHYYVTNALVDYSKDFKTIEQRRHEKELKTAKSSLHWSIGSFVIAFITLLFTLVFQMCGSQTIDREQIQSILKAINQSHSNQMIDSIEQINIIPINSEGK